ncbi:hypothetical protein ACPZ19_42470 [Amycolatopsis lurida]
MFLVQRFIEEFTDLAGRDGWTAGFVEDGFALFARPHGEGLHAEIGLDVTPRESGLSLNPSIGVRHVGISELTARLFGLKRGATPVGTFLSSLVPASEDGGRTRWAVHEENELTPVSQRILTDVETYGTLFFSPYSSLRDLIDSLADKAKLDFELGHLAVAYTVAGEVDEGRAVLSRLEDRAREQPPPAAEQTQGFLAAYRQHFGVVDN